MVLEQRDPIALAQQKKVTAAARVYKAAADAVSAMYAEIGNDDRGNILLAKTEPDYRKWRQLLHAKNVAAADWQKEAYKHADLFIPLKAPKNVDPHDHRSDEEKAEDEVW